MLVQWYLFEVNRHLTCSTVNNPLVYADLAPHTDDNIDLWMSQARLWCRCIFNYLEESSCDLSHKLRYLLDRSISHSPDLSFPKFYMLGKAHKCRAISWEPHGGWVSRPIMALRSWFSTVHATLRTFMGLCFLKCDQPVCPLNPGLIGTFVVVQRLPLTLEHHAFANQIRTSFNFLNLYTQLQWSGVSLSFRFWHNKYLSDDAFAAAIAANER